MTTSESTHTVTLTPVRIPSGGWHLAGTLYAAASQTPSPTPILVALSPLAEERKGCVRPLAELGRSFAARGGRMLVFDYAGTGDSPRDFTAVTWQTLVQNARDAVAFARTWAGSGNAAVSLLGIRLGARLALTCAAEMNKKPPPLCFWEPVVSGKKWLHEARRRSRFRRGQAGTDTPEEKSTSHSAKETSEVADIDGYGFSPALCESLVQMQELDAAIIPATPPRVITFAPKAQATAAMQRLCKTLDATPVVLSLAPFWLETDVVDSAELIRETLGFA